MGRGVLTAFPDKFAAGWGGGSLEGVAHFEPQSFLSVLDCRYSSDAHFVPYYLVDKEGSPLPTPRLNKGSHVDPDTGSVEGLGLLRYDFAVIDVDGPDHVATSAWVDEQLAKVIEESPWGSSVGWYQTRGGYRLLWRLPEPLPPAPYLRALSAIRAGLAAVGVEADELTDYNRLYRLPHVVRDGEAQEFPSSWGNLTEPIPLSVTEPSSASPLAGIQQAKVKKKIEATITQNRNTALTRFAGVLRNQGLELEEITEMLSGINESRCDPPLPEKEVEQIARSICRYDVPEGGTALEDGGDDDDGSPTGLITFALGSETELGEYVCAFMLEKGAETKVVFDRGRMWRYIPARGVWEHVIDNTLHRMAMRLDGAMIRTGTDRDGNPKFKPLKVSNRMTNDIAAVCCKRRFQRGWLDNAREGIVFRNTFVEVSPEGVEEQPHSPDHRQTASLPFDFEPAAEPTLFLEMLRACWKDQEDIESRIELLREWIGAALTNRAVRYQKGLILVGGGANGKSTIQSVVKALFPPKTVTAIAPQDFAQEYRRAELAPARLNIVSELPEADILAAEAVKAMITGDLVTGREIRKAPFSFHPRAAHLFSANALPGVRDMSKGFWRRWIVLNFTREFAEQEQDRTLASRVVATELPALASWALRGAASLAARGHYAVPQSSVESLQEWKEMADQVAAFLADRCTTETEELTPASRAYNHYCSWVEANGHRKLSSRKFGQRLVALGVEKKATKAWNGYRLLVRPSLQVVAGPTSGGATSGGASRSGSKI